MIRSTLVAFVVYILTVGTVALCVCLLFAGLRRRFSLRHMFVVVTAVAVAAGGWAWVRNQYRWQMNALNAVLARHPEVKVVEILTNDDIFLEVEVVRFHLADQPDTYYELHIPHEADETEMEVVLNHVLLHKRPVSFHRLR